IGNIISGEENSMFVTGNCEGEVWMTEGALDFSTTPTWRKIGQFESNFTCVSAIAVSSNGTDVYVGTTSGEILHITDLDKENPTLIETSATENFQYISSINVLQNPNHIIVGLGNYGHASNIMESINAASQNPSFTSLQSNLPLMPVYSVARNPLEPNTLLVGTELGIWQYDFAAQTWTEENGIMGRVPVHSLQFEQMREISCNVLYAATHGRGMYRTTDFTFGSCDTEIAVGIASLEDQITSLQLFPNPLQSHSNLEIVLNETTDLTLRIFDLQGQMVRQQSLGEMTARKHSIRIEKRDLRTGMYLVMLQSGKRQMSRKLMVD
ncbi:MAG: T9SS type A sorting domain-containing protein, partial [Chitinophagales bacterium]